MGFKVGDTVRHHKCGSPDCNLLNKTGVVVKVAPGYIEWDSGQSFWKEDQLELVSPVELVSPIGKLDESRLSEVAVKVPVTEEGRKDDSGKPRWSLLLGTALLPSVKSVLNVLMFGARKYAEDNWLKVPNARERYYDALLRHLTEWKAGKHYDDDSGLPTLAHAACDALFLLAFDILDGVLPDGKQ